MAEPDHAPGRRRAAPEKGGGPIGPTRAPTHARPAARPASRPPEPPTVLTGVTPVDRPTARPPQRPVAEVPVPAPVKPPVRETPPTPEAKPRSPRLTPLTRFARQARSAVSGPVPIDVVAPAPVTSVPKTGAPVQIEPAAGRVEPAPPPARVPPRARPSGPPEPAPDSARAAEPEPAQAPAPRDRRSTRSTGSARRVLPRRTAVVAEASGEPARQPRSPQGPAEILLRRFGWLLVTGLGVLGIGLSRAQPDLPAVLREIAAVAVSGGLAWALAVRTGGRPVWAAGLAAGVGTAAVVAGTAALLGAAAVGTGVLAATLAVMSTVPAATFRIAIREVVIASAIAWIGAFGVIGYGPKSYPEVDPARFGYTVLGLSLAGAFALVYRLGAGLHGLGRRGYVVAGGAVLMLAFALAYSEALAHWGSRDLIDSVDQIRDQVRSHLGAVPHPIVGLLGYPALLWGVFMRARRRQGWWVTAFGVAATAPATTQLLAGSGNASAIALGALYSLVVGTVLGYLVIRAEQALAGSHGRRARRDEEAVAHRPEPGRTHSLH